MKLVNCFLLSNTSLSEQSCRLFRLHPHRDQGSFQKGGALNENIVCIVEMSDPGRPEQDLIGGKK